MKKRILTGDRPTGPMHLGHYFGSLQNRVQLQDEYETYIIIADWQVLYDHLEDEKGQKIQENIKNVLLDNLASGLDPDKVTFFVQSQIPELAELTFLFNFLVTVARAKRNPTVKDEMNQNKVDFENMNLGFLSFPVSQAADILLPKAHLVPVGEDQLPHIEQTREIARKFNRLFGETFPEPEGLVSQVPRLRGLDGQAKMSKSLGNTINLSDSPAEVEAKIKKAYSGEDHALFEWAELFRLDYKQFEQDGVIQMGKFKPALADAINAFLKPIHERRAQYENDPHKLREIIETGNAKMRALGQATLDEVRTKMHLHLKF